jgi:hypothetical protein
MRMRTLTALVGAIALSGALMTVTASPAEAGYRNNRGVFIIKRHNPRFYVQRRPGLYLRLGAPIRYAYRTNRCGWLRSKALRTGSAIWWNRWQDCRANRYY